MEPLAAALAFAPSLSVLSPVLPSASVSGSLSVGEVAALLEPPTLQLLRKECGGLQTLLKNNHQVFRGASPHRWNQCLLPGGVSSFPSPNSGRREGLHPRLAGPKVLQSGTQADARRPGCPENSPVLVF